MGCPEIYYKKALQKFSHSLFIQSDGNKAKHLKNENSIEKLESEIMKQSKNVSMADFIFDAGIVTGMLLECANRDDGCDGLNACMGGLNSFEDFIKSLIK